jgi:hypothetical protein
VDIRPCTGHCILAHRARKPRVEIGSSSDRLVRLCHGALLSIHSASIITVSALRFIRLYLWEACDHRQFVLVEGFASRQKKLSVILAH